MSRQAKLPRAPFYEAKIKILARLGDLGDFNNVFFLINYCDILTLSYISLKKFLKSMTGPLLPSPDHNVHIIIWNEVGSWAHEDLKCGNMVTKICVQFWGSC